MNILIPHTWLLEHLETEASPQEIQRLLSLSGPSIERIYDREGERVYDIEVTTNRVDSMSVRGIAREAAVILSQAGIPARLKPLQIREIPHASEQKEESEDTALPLPKIENDASVCKRITCVILSKVQHTATPPAMAQRLKQIEQNIHDSVIDITNYITHELGHPCHAFDYDKIMALGGVIRVVTAEAGKPFTTLDGVSYKTVGGEVVFENQKGEIIDLPAIKGTANTAVDDSTANVLLWIESIDHQKVRHGSMSHAIRTVAAQLNEKQVDPHLANSVLARGIELYTSLCNAVVASPIYDDFPGKLNPIAVVTPHKVFSRYLGIELSREKITALLEQLECQVSLDEGTSSFIITPPTFRPDLEIPADIVEEVARLYGYHNLPSTLMNTAIPLNKPSGTNFDFEYTTKRVLADLGWQELYTYSLVSEKLALEDGFSLEAHLKLQNPLTDDRVYLRRSLIPSLHEVLDNNSEHRELSIFEIANVYHPQASGLPTEELHLTLLGNQTYRAVRGVLESLLRTYFIQECNVQPLTEVTGSITVTTPEAAHSIGTISLSKKGRVAVDIIVSKVLPLLKTHPTYQPLPKAAAVTEDLTFVLPEKTAIGPIITEIINSDAMVKNAELADQFKQNHTFSIRYLDPEKSLSSVEVEPIRKRIVQIISEKFSGTLVGALK